MAETTPSRRGGPRPGAGRKPGSRHAAPSEVVRLPTDVAAFARRLQARAPNGSGIGAFLQLDGSSTAAMPFVTSKVACGFPSPADDHLDEPLDFNELVGARLPQTFAVRVEGDSMILKGIHSGDIAVICRARRPRTGDVVVAYVNKEPTLKTYIEQDQDTLILHPENPEYPDIVITKETDFEIFGVLRNIVKKF